MSVPSLQIENLTVRRGPRIAVNDVSLTVPAGQITALLGPNGAGKSSLVLAVGGILEVAAGSVAVEGRELSGRSPAAVRQAGVAVVPEGHRVLADMTVGDNLLVAGDALKRIRMQEGVARALRLFPELDHRLGQRAGSLSGGEQQMLALAQALVHKPRFLIIDELSLGLAPAIVRRLSKTLVELSSEGIGILLIEQFAEVALEISVSVNVLDQGRVTWTGHSEILHDNPEPLHSSYLRT